MARSRLKAAVLPTILLNVALLVGPANPARAEGHTYYVATNGNDANPGTIDAPWARIFTGIDRLYPGDTLYVRGGVYPERVDYPHYRLATPEAPIQVLAYPGERPVISGLWWIRHANYWTFDGISVRWDWARDAKNEFPLKLINGVGWTFRNGEVSGAHAPANVWIGGKVEGEPASWQFTGNCIHDAYPTNPNFSDHNIYVNTGLHPGWGLIERNILFNARNGFNIKFAGPSSTSGGAANITARYNTAAYAATNFVVAYGSHHIRLERNLLGPRWGGTSWYPNMRGNTLWGRGVRAINNAGWGAYSVIRNTESKTGIVNGGGNVRISNPIFDGRSCDTFHVQTTQAQNYGRFAPWLS